MKKNKLSIEKFRIAKLNNPSKIHGGTGIEDGGTLTKDKEIKDICVLTSAVKIQKPKDEIIDAG